MGISNGSRSIKSILLIDDDLDDREIFVTALDTLDKKVDCLTLDNATEALRMLYNSEVNPDVIFLDLNMPVMNGHEFLAAIKSHEVLQQIPVIIFSTSSHQSTVEAALKLGAHQFLTKPDNFDDIIGIIKSVID